MQMTNARYLDMLSEVITMGHDAKPRDMDTVEVFNYATKIPMSNPLVNLKSRNIDLGFVFSEAHWICTGQSVLDNRVRKNLEKYSDDKVTMAGAYGPRIAMQLPYIIDLLKKDPQSRQAVIHVHMPLHYTSSDMPCTLTIHFMLRNWVLNTFVTMRSSDCFLGVPYDWATFSLVSTYVATLYKEATGIDIDLGELYWHANSQHVYVRNKVRIAEILNSPDDVQFKQEGELHPFTYGPTFLDWLDELADLHTNQKPSGVAL